MVVKITKKLGFSGYRDFRSAVTQYNQLPTAEMHQELSIEDTSREIIQKVFRTSINALEETLAIIDMDAFDRAADLVNQSGQRDFYGVGGSAQIARDVAHKFLRIGIRANVQDDLHMMLMSAALLGPQDIAIGFSHSGNTTAVIEAIQLARKNGARTIAITNYNSSALAQVADIVLCSTAQGSPLMGRMPPLALLSSTFWTPSSLPSRKGITVSRRRTCKRQWLRSCRNAKTRLCKEACLRSSFLEAFITTLSSTAQDVHARARPWPASAGCQNAVARVAIRQ